ncbi:hypothetical protein J5N58_16660 [Rhizobium cremeum]|uniref:hypothetical protein n=1 Tax=Rhizobium cremeum TaxID=2813827 RepID=UPI001FD1420A|nr:hypothetical protein [Rhizobium cremeum]MCJ7996051.1 hypothetical protein [Rhizobium cremeum]MCJ8001310.1 hypothetical protein [Rhizobium cremeum]
MSERINTTAAEEHCDAFSPEGDFAVQAQFPIRSRARLYIEGRVDPAAEWEVLGSISPRDRPSIARFAKCPQVRLRVSDNKAGDNVKAWSGE